MREKKIFPSPPRFLRRNSPPVDHETQSRRLYLYAEVPQVSIQVPALPLSRRPAEIRSPLLPPTRCGFHCPRSVQAPPLTSKDPAPVPCSHSRAPFFLWSLGSTRLRVSDPSPTSPVATTSCHDRSTKDRTLKPRLPT